MKKSHHVLFASIVALLPAFALGIESAQARLADSSTAGQGALSKPSKNRVQLARPAQRSHCWGSSKSKSEGQCSDLRLKTDVVLLQHLDNGLGVYRFRYKWSDQVYVGVIAQEVEQVSPAAVWRDGDGYLRVDYKKIGFSRQTWDEWTRRTWDHPAH